MPRKVFGRVITDRIEVMCRAPGDVARPLGAGLYQALTRSELAGMGERDADDWPALACAAGLSRVDSRCGSLRHRRGHLDDQPREAVPRVGRAACLRKGLSVM